MILGIDGKSFIIGLLIVSVVLFIVLTILLKIRINLLELDVKNYEKYAIIIKGNDRVKVQIAKSSPLKGTVQFLDEYGSVHREDRIESVDAWKNDANYYFGYDRCKDDGTITYEFKVTKTCKNDRRFY